MDDTEQNRELLAQADQLAAHPHTATKVKQVKAYFKKRPIASTLIGGMTGLSVGMPTGAIAGGAIGYSVFSGATALVVVSSSFSWSHVLL